VQTTDDERTTLSLHRGLFIGTGIIFFVLALVVPMVGIKLTLDHRPYHYDDLFISIPLAALYAAILIFQGVRILRSKVTVTPSTLTSYWFQGRRALYSAERQQIEAIEIRQLPASGRRGGVGVAPYVVLRDGTGFWLRALSVNRQRDGDNQQATALDRIRNMMGISANSTPRAANPVPPTRPAEHLAPRYPPPTDPPKNYDVARYEGQPVPAEPNLPPVGSNPGWLRDPVAGADYRYFDGSRWTEWVHNGSYESVSHLPTS